LRVRAVDKLNYMDQSIFFPIFAELVRKLVIHHLWQPNVDSSFPDTLFTAYPQEPARASHSLLNVHRNLPAPHTIERVITRAFQDLTLCTECSREPARFSLPNVHKRLPDLHSLCSMFIGTC